VLETVTSQQSYLAHKPAEKSVVEKKAKQPKTEDSKPVNAGVYIAYTDKPREKFIDKMIERPQEKGNITRFAKELMVNPHIAGRWWKTYEKSGEVSYKKSKDNSGPKTTIFAEHEPLY
jgi:hypothetical protein